MAWFVSKGKKKKEIITCIVHRKLIRPSENLSISNFQSKTSLRSVKDQSQLFLLAQTLDKSLHAMKSQVSVKGGVVDLFLFPLTQSCEMLHHL